MRENFTGNACVLARLREQGFSVVGSFLPATMRAINSYLLAAPVFADAHVPQAARNRNVFDTQLREDAWQAERLCVATGTAICMPFLLEAGLALTNLASEYLDCVAPVVYSMNAFWTRPGPTAPFWDIQEFHRDADDERFLALFLYLTDVLTEEDGPHKLKGPDGAVRDVYGPAGTLFVADTKHEHLGLKPTSKERGIAWLRWGVSARPAAYAWDGLEPISKDLLGARYPSDLVQRHTIRLLVV